MKSITREFSFNSNHGLTYALLLVVFLFGVTIRSRSQSYIFTTLAGSASSGSANGTGSAARFSTPTGVVWDPQGNLYVADTGNETVRQITPAGVVSTIAGQAGGWGYADGTGTNALFASPQSLAIDTGGNLYLVDNDMIRKLTPSGTNWVVSTLAGQPGNSAYADQPGTNALFNRPSGVAVDGAGNVYVADQFNNVIRKITPTGTVSTLAGQPNNPGSADGTNDSAQFYYPFNITVDGATNLYITDSVNQTIRKLAPVGTNWVVTTIAGQVQDSGSTNGIGTNAQFSGPTGIVVDRTTNIYVADGYNDTIRLLVATGTNWTVSKFAGTVQVIGDANGAANTARFTYPNGLTVDNAGNVYVADANNNLIREISKGVVSTVAGSSTGSTDGPGTNALFWNTAGVAADGVGNVFVADYDNNTVRKIGTNGIVSTLAGLAGNPGSVDGTNSNARFNNPYSLAVDLHDNVFVVSTGDSTVRKLTASGTNWTVTTIAGFPGHVGVADGVGTNAAFYNPAGITVDTNDTLYVVDNSGMTIRKVTPSGTNWDVSTIAGQPTISGYTNGIGTNALFLYPHSIAVDNSSNVYVADTENQVIRKLTLTGTNWLVSTIAGLGGISGSTDGVGTNALFFFPEGVTVDNTGNLFVADTFNQTIRKITRVGTNWVTSTAGGTVEMSGSADGLGPNALFSAPQAVAVDAKGRVYVADTQNNTVRVGVMAIPSLQVASAKNDQIILSWPDWATAFTLETSGKLLASNGWLPFTNEVITVGTNFSVTADVGVSNAFFRLSNP
jgi:hypothetical protein